MSVIIGLIVVYLLAVAMLRTPKPPSNMPTVFRSTGGYDSHLDFLEMHGFISEEEREAQREASRHFREHPEQYKTVTMKELKKKFRIED